MITTATFPRSFIRSRIAALLVALTILAGTTRAEDNLDLKLTRVSLFSSGVGFFHRQADVNDTATARLQFQAAQINDILKSLVVQDLDGGKVGVVSYASRDPIEKTLGSFGVNLTGNPTLAKILDQLRGEAVEISGPRQLKGTIIGIERRDVTIEKEKTQIEYLNLLTEQGLQQLKLGELTGIKLTSEKVQGELNKALAALAMGHDADKKSVMLRFEGQGKRRVSASFLLETPIWKTSYRLVLSKEGKPFLQGWALVENATQEDWKDVRLSLVSGRPISFVMDLYTPLYMPRPVEELELFASLRPPDYAMSLAFGDKVEGGMGGGGMMGGGMMGGLPKAGSQRGATAEKSPALSVVADADGNELLMRAANFGQTRSFFSINRSSGVQSVASAEKAGELFEYKIDAPVSIARQNSAMLPILNQDIAADKVSIYNRATHEKFPLNGLILDNSTGLHLMQGPITVFADNVYAGDAVLPDLRKGEKRMLAYALDLGMEVHRAEKPQVQEIVALKITKGSFWKKTRIVAPVTYACTNKEENVRTLIIEHPYDESWTLLEPAKPYEKAANLLRFKLEVPAGKSADLSVTLERQDEEQVAMTALSDEQMGVYIRTKSIAPAVRDALQKAIAMRADAASARAARERLEKQVAGVVAEQARIRENLKTLDRSSDAYARQLKKFDALETQIETGNEEIAAARKTEADKIAALDQYLLNLTLE